MKVEICYNVKENSFVFKIKRVVRYENSKKNGNFILGCPDREVFDKIKELENNIKETALFSCQKILKKDD